MLCSPCEAILKNPTFSRHKAVLDPNIKEPVQMKAALRSDFREHHPTFASFEQALNNKCALCMRLVRSGPGSSLLRKLFPNEGAVDPELDLSQFSTASRLSFETPSRTVIGLLALVRSKRQGKDWSARGSTFFFLAGEQTPLSLPKLPPPDRSDDDRIFTQISSWIHKCQADHSKCKRQQQTGTQPYFARIIDVANSINSSTVSLCKAEELPFGAIYMTLSHCWGGAAIPMLHLAEYENFFESIAMIDLPQTFIDAINVTRRLEVRYLWIDSLCIVQDSHTDWVNHAEVMGKIYEGSYCNIAASGSKNPFGGLFRQREPVLITPLRVNISGALGNNENGWYDVGDDFARDWSLQVGNSTLGNRAWVVQERLLSPRCVHFGEKQLYWECVELQSREGDLLVGADKPNSRNVQVDFKLWDPFESSLTTSPDTYKLGADYVWSSLKRLRSQESQQFTEKMLKTDSKALAEASMACFNETSWTRSHPLLIYWSGIARPYSNALLTRLDDRLVAIAGLAKILSERVEGIRYVAGLWSYQLPRQLLSTSIAGMKPNPVIDSYLAPSWSWASNQIGPVTNLRLEDAVEEDGAMDLIKVINIEVKGLHGEDDPFGQIKSGRLRVQGRLIPIELDLSNWPEPNERNAHVVEYWQASALDSPVRETFLVPILLIRWSVKLPLSTPNGLLLEATENKGEFRRIGTARLSDNYPLNWCVPYLYATQKSTLARPNEDEQDEENEQSSGQASALATEHDDGPTTVKSISPREELQALQVEKASNPEFQDRLEDFKGLVATGSKTVAGRDQAKQFVSAFSSILTRSAHNLPGHRGHSVPQKAAALAERRGVQNETHSSAEIASETSQPMQPLKRPVPAIVQAHNLRQRPPRLPILRLPKEMVAPRFYTEYLADESSTRFGHFVFDIV